MVRDKTILGEMDMNNFDWSKHKMLYSHWSEGMASALFFARDKRDRQNLASEVRGGTGP